MVPGRARRLVGIGAGLAVALVGCGAGPGADGAPTPGASGGTTPESDVCVVVETATGGLLLGLFLDNAGEPTPEGTTRLQNGLVRYADLVRENATGTTHPVLRSVLDRAVAAAEAASDVTTVEELRRTPFKDATIEVGRVCRQVANGQPITLPTADPTPEAEPGPAAEAEASEPGTPVGPLPGAGRTGLGPVCGIPVTFDVPDGWVPDPVDVEPDSGLASIYTAGPFLQRCSIDGSYVGDGGGVSVAVAAGSPADLRRSVDAYLAETGGDTYELRDVTRSEVRVDGRPAIEVDYEEVNEYGVTTGAICVLAVPDGLVLLRMNQVPDFDLAPIRAAYELAKRTLRVS